MKIDLPTWKPEYEPHVTEAAYNNILAEIKPLLDRCVQIYEAYLKTGNDILNEVFCEVAAKMWPKFRLLAAVGARHELQSKSETLEKAAEIISRGDELPYKAVMLYAFAGIVRGR